MITLPPPCHLHSHLQNIHPRSHHSLLCCILTSIEIDAVSYPACLSAAHPQHNIKTNDSPIASRPRHCPPMSLPSNHVSTLHHSTPSKRPIYYTQKYCPLYWTKGTLPNEPTWSLLSTTIPTSLQIMHQNTTNPQVNSQSPQFSLDSTNRTLMRIDMLAQSSLPRIPELDRPVQAAAVSPAMRPLQPPSARQLPAMSDRGISSSHHHNASQQRQQHHPIDTAANRSNASTRPDATQISNIVAQQSRATQPSHRILSPTDVDLRRRFSEYDKSLADFTRSMDSQPASHTPIPPSHRPPP